MSLTYTKIRIRKQPTTFKRLFGLSVEEFERILKAVIPEWEKRVIGKYKRPRRNYKLDVAGHILMLLLYYRSYISQDFVAYLFGIDKSRVSRNIETLELILAKVIAITKTRHITQKEIEEIIIDATEQPIERPKKDRRISILERKSGTSIRQGFV